MLKLLSILLFTSSVAHAQTPAPTPAFEVATTRPVLMDSTHPFDPRHFGVHIDQSRATYWSLSPIGLMEHAYHLRHTQVAGPEWTDHDRFDVEARLPDGADKDDERKMLQTLLKDRFNLTFHIEQRQFDGYVLVVGKHGEKLPPSLPVAIAGAAPTGTQKNSGGYVTVNLGTKGTSTTKFDNENRLMVFDRSKIDMEELAGMMNICLDPSVPAVPDVTGLKGFYHVTWDCPLLAPDKPLETAAPGAPMTFSRDMSRLTSSLDAVGLKLEKRKITQAVYVIDHIDKPSEN